MPTPNIIPVPAGLPKGEWSAPAIRVLEERYLWKDETGKVVESPDEAMWRVARAIALAEEQEERSYQRAGSIVDWGYRVVDGRIHAWAEKFYRELVSRRFMPNSPTIANAGKGNGLAHAACYVVPVEDSLEGIFDAVKWQAVIHQSGGGTGFSFSRLRPNGSMVGSTKGVASGPVSFMKIFDVATEQVKQGGMRRGANMGILRVDHSDILEFITCKMQDAKTGRYPIQNFNISVAITDEFMDSLKGNGQYADNGHLYDLVDPHTDTVTERLDARTVWAKIIECAHATGDPGLWFIDRANASRANPLPDLYQLEACNPCGEQALEPFGVCNLGSLNLSEFVESDNVASSINWTLLAESVHIAVRFLDNVITVNSYPHPQIDYWAKAGRRIGLGVMGWADLLMKLRIPYASEEARKLGEQVMSFIDNTALAASRDLAEERGPFLLWDRSIYKDSLPLRNCARTTVAPTGTISIIAGCSSGIEPAFALAYQHRVGERVLSFVNPYVEQRLKELALSTDEPGLDPTLIRKHIAATGQYPKLGTYPQDIAVFKTALEIAPEDHVRMQAAFQRHVDNSISKTVNLPFTATVEDVDQAYRLAWETDCMGITVFRTGSKDGVQVLYAGTSADGQQRASDDPTDEERAAYRKLNNPTEEEMAVYNELYERAANILQQQTAKVATSPSPTFIKARPHRVTGSTVEMDTPLGHAFITVNSDDEGQPLEVFVTIGKAGSDTQADAEAIGRLLSLLFRVPSTMTPKARAAEAIEQLRGIGGRRSTGFGPDRVRSVPDAIAQALQEFMLEARRAIVGNPATWPEASAETKDGTTIRVKYPDVDMAEKMAKMAAWAMDNERPLQWPESNETALYHESAHLGQRADLCPQCGDAALIHQEGCVTCLACAYTEC